MLLQAGRCFSLRHLGAPFWLAICAPFWLAISCPAAHAQSGMDSLGTGGRHSIQGRLIFNSGQRADVRLKVRLESTSNISGDLSILTDANGGFNFGGLRAGTYTVLIDGGEEFESVKETVRIESDTAIAPRGVVVPQATRPYTLQIYLQPKGAGGPESRPGVINAALAGVPKPAVELYHKAIEAARNNDPNKAVEHLKAALALHPDFVIALSQLGAQYLKLKQPDKAAEALRAALKLKPDDYALLLSYGIALFDQGNLGAAEEQLRLTLKKNEASPSAHLYLGLTLIKRRSLDEAEKELLRAVVLGGEQMGRAHYYLGGLYWARRDYKRAATELETYLKLSPNLPAAERERVHATIKDLRSKS